jgi:hypothetical protein
MDNFNARLAKKITSGVATMWCAYIFAALALVSLPRAIQSGDTLVIVSWIAQTFLQLVLLSIIMVGQKAQSANVEKQISETHEAALAELKELKDLSREIHVLMTDVRKKLN